MTKTKQKKAAGYQTPLGVRELTPAIAWDKLDAAASASVPPEAASVKPGYPDWVSYKVNFTTTARIKHLVEEYLTAQQKEKV